MTDETVPVSPEQPPAGGVPGPGPAPAAPHSRRGAIWWGVVLVFIGAALLLGQLVPGIELWRYWPLIIIAFGVRGLFGPTGGPWTVRALGDGLQGIAIGLVFLGQMLGYLDWNVWLNILRLWPLLLVALGVEVIGKGLRSEFVRLIGSLVIVGGLAYGALVMTPTTGWITAGLPTGPSERFERSAAHESGIEEGSARIGDVVGVLTVGAGDDLAAIDGYSPFEPEFDITTGDTTARVACGLGSHSWGPLEGRAELNVALDRDVAWDLDIAAGVSEYDVDLRELAVRDLTFDAGVSDGTLTLGTVEAAGTDEAVPVDVSSGVSAIAIKVPENDNVRVVVKGGLVGLDTDGDWSVSRSGGDRVYESDGFDAADPYWDIEIQAGVGSITIAYY